MKVDWDKEELIRLYWTENNSLREIAGLKGVSRERVNQVMKRFDISRRDKSARQQNRHQALRFKSLSDYLTSGKDNTTTIHKYLPANITCSECRSREHLHIHHIKYPAQEKNDIQILCHSCHKIKHIKGIAYLQQIDIYNAYIFGVSAEHLAKQYNCSLSNITKVIYKIKHGLAALKR